MKHLLKTIIVLAIILACLYSNNISSAKKIALAYSISNRDINEVMDFYQGVYFIGFIRSSLQELTTSCLHPKEHPVDDKMVLFFKKDMKFTSSIHEFL